MVVTGALLLLSFLWVLFIAYLGALLLFSLGTLICIIYALVKKRTGKAVLFFAFPATALVQLAVGVLIFCHVTVWGYYVSLAQQDGLLPTALYFGQTDLAALYLNLDLFAASDQQIMDATIRGMEQDKVAEGDLSALTMVLEQGVDPNVWVTGEEEGEYQRTPLVCAIDEFESAAMVSLLLEHGADPNAVGESGLNPLHHISVYQEDAYEILTLLLEAGADPLSVDWEGETVKQNLQHALALQDPQSVDDYDQLQQLVESLP